MALTPEKIEQIAGTVSRGNDHEGHIDEVEFARAIETEVHKADEELIRQLLDALETCDNAEGYNGPYQFHDDKLVETAIIAAKLRLEQAC